MKTKHPTEIAITLSGNDDMRKDVVAKHLFSINEVVAWLLKSCVPEYSQMEVSDIIREQLAKADIRLGTEPVGQDVRPCVPIVGTEDNSVTDGTVYYDLRTELPLPGASQKSPLLVLDVEMQKDYDSWLLFYKRVIYYISRLVSSQPGHLTSGQIDYARLCRVCSIWIIPTAPKHLANHVRHMSFKLEDVTGKSPVGVRLPCKLTDAWVFFIRDGFPPTRKRDIFWLLYVLLTRTMTCEKKLKILEEDFGIKSTKEVEQMYGYSEFLWTEGKKEGKTEGKIEGKIEGKKEGRLEGQNETLLTAYTNMKNANATDGYICAMLGISKRKLREIKRLFNETIARETSPLT